MRILPAGPLGLLPLSLTEALRVPFANGDAQSAIAELSAQSTLAEILPAGPLGLLPLSRTSNFLAAVLPDWQKAMLQNYQSQSLYLTAEVLGLFSSFW